MSLADLPNELVIEVVKLLNNVSRTSLAATSTGFQEIVAPLFWKKVGLKLHNPVPVNTKTLKGICSKLAKHVKEVTLSTGDDAAKSQETFQTVLDAIRLRLLVALRLQKCRLENESCRKLADAFIQCLGNWNSSLREVLLPRQNTDVIHLSRLSYGSRVCRGQAFLTSWRDLLYQPGIELDPGFLEARPN